MKYAASMNTRSPAPSEMIASATLGLFVLAALALLLIPGPAVTYIVTRSLTQGRRIGLASVAGVELGGAVYAVAATLGLTGILLESALAFDLVKYVGAAYLAYLGISRLVARRDSVPPERGPTTPRRAFTSGFLVELLNPKTAMFFVAFLPQFVNPAAGDVTVQLLTLGLIFVALGSCTDSLYTVAASAGGTRLMRWLDGRSSPRRWQRYAQAGVYIGLAAVAALEQPTAG